jgi:hypothetical protein
MAMLTVGIENEVEREMRRRKPGLGPGRYTLDLIFCIPSVARSETHLYDTPATHRNAWLQRGIGVLNLLRRSCMVPRRLIVSMLWASADHVVACTLWWLADAVKAPQPQAGAPKTVRRFKA